MPVEKLENMHENAAGLGIAASNIPSLMQFMNTKYSSESFANCYLVDYILDAKNNNESLLRVLAEHQDYYGNGIDEPRLVVKNISLANIMAMGTNKDSMKISYNGIDYVHFKDLNFVEEVSARRTKLLTVFGRANLNTFAGKTSVQFFIDDYEFVDNTHKYDF